VLSNPIVIHMHRPYASEEEYLAHESFSIEAKSMLLLDQPALPLDTAVVFDVTLDNGDKPIRAEARVVGYLEPEGDRPGGVRVRFRRFGAATKAFIDRAVSASSAGPLVAQAEAPAPTAEPVPVPVPVPVRVPVPPEHRSVADSSGVHHKAVLPVSAPANRDALLARLRARRTG
jgi:hypothetical protein